MTTVHTITDDPLADIRALLNLPYPEIAARPSGWSAVLASARTLLAQLDKQVATEFPGVPGSLWRDANGTVWILCGDGRLRQTSSGSDPNEAARVFGPMTPTLTTER